MGTKHSTTKSNMIREILRPRVDVIVENTLSNIRSQMYGDEELSRLEGLELPNGEINKFIAHELVRRLTLTYDL